MAGSLLDAPVSLVSLRPSEAPGTSAGCQDESAAKGFARSRPGSKVRSSGTKGRRKKGTGLSAADHGPLGRSPCLEAIEARSRLGLALSGRLRESDVTQAWKRAAAEHHPDRGGRHDTMQAVNGARDVLLGRGLG